MKEKHFTYYKEVGKFGIYCYYYLTRHEESEVTISRSEEKTSSRWRHAVSSSGAKFLEVASAESRFGNFRVRAFHSQNDESHSSTYWLSSHGFYSYFKYSSKFEKYKLIAPRTKRDKMLFVRRYRQLNESATV